MQNCKRNHHSLALPKGLAREATVAILSANLFEAVRAERLEAEDVEDVDRRVRVSAGAVRLGARAPAHLSVSRVLQSTEGYLGFSEAS